MSVGVGGGGISSLLLVFLFGFYLSCMISGHGDGSWGGCEISRL